MSMMADKESESSEKDSISLVLAKGHPSGITQLPKGSEKYNAATNLIGVGVNFDSCSAGPVCTIFKLEDVPKRNPNYHLPNKDWVKSTRLDSQGDIISNEHKYARLAVQIGNETNAQANVQIGVTFGRRGIRNALQQSLDTAKVIFLSNNKAFIEKAQFLGHSVMTLEMCQALAEQED